MMKDFKSMVLTSDFQPLSFADQSCLHIFLRGSNISSFVYSLESLPFKGIL